MKFSVFNVYDSGERFLMDFIIPCHRVDDLLDYQWEVDIESAVEGLMSRLGASDTIAVADRTITSSLDELKTYPRDAYIYSLESDTK